MKLLVGLGNPGEKYQLTRHNVGFMILDNFINTVSAQDWDKKFDSFFKKISSNEKNILLIKPLTFMNLSGNAVQKVKNFYNIDKNNVIIIHDDIDLELGRIKLKDGGRAGFFKAGLRYSRVSAKSDFRTDSFKTRFSRILFV